jgi:hypothetical protein
MHIDRRELIGGVSALSGLKIVGAGALAAASASCATTATGSNDAKIGRAEISTVPFDSNLSIRSATYTPSGKVLVAYAESSADHARQVNLAVMDDDGANVRRIFSQRLPDREKDNGLRYMVCPDNRRIFLGDFMLECAPNIDACERSTLVPVEYPAQVASGDHIAHRWSEMIIAPDNEHVSWTTLFANYSAMVFVGRLEKAGDVYRIVSPQIISTVNSFVPDLAHPGAVVPQRIRGGEVKQFVRGGTAISLVGAGRRDTPDSVVQDLLTDTSERITDTPGYTETTIFSPDEQLGIVMTSRFSEHTDLAVLGLMPRPYPGELNMGLSMLAYTYSVTGVRRSRPGSVGPALIDIAASRAQAGYRGVNLNTEDAWVYYSPMSWHPSSRKAMWMEGHRETGQQRIQIVRLPDYTAAPAVQPRPTPATIPYAIRDLSVIDDFLRQSREISARVHGRTSGHIDFHRTADGRIEKTYVDFSDDGESQYSGSERIELNPRANSTYLANVQLTGAKAGMMNLKMTFGPLGSEPPARLLFEPDSAGVPLTHGFAEYDGERREVAGLVP